MDGEQNGSTQAQEQNQQEGNQQAQAAQTQPAGDGAAAGIDASAYEDQISERDTRIKELESQIAEAARNAEAAEQLRNEIAELKAQGESDRLDFKLQLAGCRNVKAARAVLEDHGGDVEKLKEAEPWLFADEPQKASGKNAKPGIAIIGSLDLCGQEYHSS